MSIHWEETVPSEREVEDAITALGITGYEAQEMRNFWNHEREREPAMVPSGKELLMFFGKLLLFGAVGWMFVVLFLSL